MRALCRVWCLLCSLLFLPLTAAAAPRYTVSLLSMSPGWHPFERLGHTALAIEDHVAHTELAYNFGTIDEREQDVWRKSVEGRLPYSLSTMNPGQVALVYAAREIRVQELALGDARAARLVAILTENLRPERRAYRYDFFENNCVTRVRDLLDQVTEGALRKALTQPDPRTFRQEVEALLGAVPLQWSLMDLVYGPYTDVVGRSRYQALYVPGALHDALAEVSLPAEGGGVVPLVRGERTFRGSEYAAQTEWPSARALPLGLALLLLLGVGLTLAGVAWGRALIGGAGALLALLLGGLGAVLLWFSTSPHPCLMHNSNRALFSPAALLLVVSLLVVAWRPARAGRARAAVLAGVVLAGLLWLRCLVHGGAHLLGRCPQAHSGVLLWALGLHGALLLGLVVAALRRRP